MSLQGFPRGCHAHRGGESSADAVLVTPLVVADAARAPALMNRTCSAARIRRGKGRARSHEHAQRLPSERDLDRNEAVYEGRRGTHRASECPTVGYSWRNAVVRGTGPKFRSRHRNHELRLLSAPLKIAVFDDNRLDLADDRGLARFRTHRNRGHLSTRLMWLRGKTMCIVHWRWREALIGCLDTSSLDRSGARTRTVA